MVVHGRWSSCRRQINRKDGVAQIYMGIVKTISWKECVTTTKGGVQLGVLEGAVEGATHNGVSLFLGIRVMIILHTRNAFW